jgi:hypothetical protein
MDDDLVTKIAGESKEKASKRQETIHTLEKLEEGARTCRKYAPRPSSSGELPNKHTLSLLTDPDICSISASCRIKQCCTTAEHY